tara:strand:+ start:898 stop:1128 length:231 start_codon:yes stop_codon:yes gene_type:complete
MKYITLNQSGIKTIVFLDKITFMESHFKDEHCSMLYLGGEQIKVNHSIDEILEMIAEVKLVNSDSYKEMVMRQGGF